jgi:hypothetical protein
MSGASGRKEDRGEDAGDVLGPVLFSRTGGQRPARSPLSGERRKGPWPSRIRWQQDRFAAG